MQRNVHNQTGFNPPNPFQSTQKSSKRAQNPRSSQTREKKTVGEYIDFEEID